MWAPHIPLRTIDKVNSAIDNPNRKMVALQNSGIIDNKTMDYFKLGKHGHRKYNHSIASAFAAAYMVDPKHAADLAMIHLIGDRMSNYMHDRVGTSDKEVIESLINKQYDMFRITSDFGRKRRQKKMYY